MTLSHAELQQKLKSRFNYNPDTGAFTNAIDCPRMKVSIGEDAGFLTKTRLQTVYFNGKRHPVGVLIILYMEGIFPSYTGRHDRNTKNNRYKNIFISEHRCVYQKPRINKKSENIMSKSQKFSKRMYKYHLMFYRICHDAMIDYEPLKLNHEHKLHV